MPEYTVLDTHINDLTQHELLGEVRSRLATKQPGYIVTVNTELLLLARENPAYHRALEAATWRTCDGVGVQWGAVYSQLRLPKIIKIIGLPVTGLRLLIHPAYARKLIKHRYSGRILFHDLLKMGSEQKLRVFFLGAGPGIASQVARQASVDYPGIIVAGSHEGSPDEPSEILESLKSSDLLFVAYGSPKQELFIHNHLDQLQTKIAIGVGGTFDYYTKAKPIGSPFRALEPPRWIHNVGLEWAWRLITQPNRAWRIFRSVVIFAWVIATRT